MKQKTRWVIGLVVLLLIVVLVLAGDALRRSLSYNDYAAASSVQVTLEPGNIPIYLNSNLVAGFSPEDIEKLEKVNFVDAEEGKIQEGWMLSDVLLLYIDPEQLQEDTVIMVTSSSREKSVELTWAEIQNQENMVMFDLSGRGTLKLISQTLEYLDTRDEWVQDVDKIEVSLP